MAVRKSAIRVQVEIDNDADVGSIWKSFVDTQLEPLVKLAAYENRKCKLCDKMFASEKNRDTHLKRMHNVANDAIENDHTDENGKKFDEDLDAQRNEKEEQSAYLFFFVFFLHLINI